MKIKVVRKQGCGCDAYPFCAHAPNAIEPIIVELEKNSGLVLVADNNGKPSLRWTNYLTSDGDLMPAGIGVEHSIKHATLSELREWLAAVDGWLTKSENDSLRARGDCRWQAANTFSHLARVEYRAVSLRVGR
jgi:hypothetical protein